VGCVFSLLGFHEPALEYLEKTVCAGFTQKGWYEHDGDLDSLRLLPRFQELLEKIH
jgi:adenylate cyclase